jgi:hypothetical protein
VGTVVLYLLCVDDRDGTFFWWLDDPQRPYPIKKSTVPIFFSKKFPAGFRNAMSKIDASTAKRLRDRPYYAYLYARNVVKGRLPPKLEEVFVREPRSAYLYAKHVMKGRLPDFVHNGLILSNVENKDDQIFLQMYLNEMCKEQGHADHV